MKQEYSRDLYVDVQSYSKLEKKNIWHMIVFSLFLIINSHLSTAFTAMLDGCLYYFPKDTFLEPLTQLMIFVQLFDYLLKTII